MNYIPTEQLGEAALTLLLMKLYKDDLSDDMSYENYDGKRLPYPSGGCLANACLTFIKHGGDKSRAIEKFLDKHLRSCENIEMFLQRAAALKLTDDYGDY